ncbi:MAG TPA: hypothetical protein VGI61_04135 [Parafilimonas sp.]
MKKSLFLFLLLLPFLSFGQLHLITANNSISIALEKVIEDFPNHFNNIRGEVISKDVQAINYTSSVNIAGADSSIIIQNGNDSDNIYSWTETVFATDDFDKAKEKFHEYFTKIKATGVTIENKKLSFHAEYVSPDDAKHFTTILFTTDNEAPQLKNVVIDLSMQYVLSGWQIIISVYEHTDYGVDDTGN